MRRHGEAARSVLAKVGDDVFALFHAVSPKLRSRTRNSQFGLLGDKFFMYSPLDVKESDDHVLEIAFHLSGLFWPW